MCFGRVGISFSTSGIRISRGQQYIRMYVQETTKEGKGQIRDNKVVEKGDVHTLYRNMCCSSQCL
jgi:hypothetical protein